MPEGTTMQRLDALLDYARAEVAILPYLRAGDTAIEAAKEYGFAEDPDPDIALLTFTDYTVSCDEGNTFTPDEILRYVIIRRDLSGDQYTGIRLTFAASQPDALQALADCYNDQDDEESVHNLLDLDNREVIRFRLLAQEIGTVPFPTHQPVTP